jgi:pilus assembly protein Flp/PilA
MAAVGSGLRPPSASMDMNRHRLNDRNERGASAVEYGLLIVGIAALIVIVVYALGGNVLGIFTDTCGSVAAKRGATC